MSRHATDVQEPVPESSPSPPLPPDHVLYSGAVLFPGAFDQHGCPLIVFPVDGQAKLSSEVGKAEVVDFINYFLCLHNKKQEKESSVSVVADLRQASLQTTRFVAETLLLLELVPCTADIDVVDFFYRSVELYDVFNDAARAEHMQIVHSAYIIQPKKKDVVKLLLKFLAPSKYSSSSLKKVLLKDVPELCNHIDRSQLTAPLGGYLIYCHQSWVSFIKEIDAFVKEFLSVVQRLPSCISTLHALSRLPLPSSHSELQLFCSINEAKFLQLRRELGLDQLLCHCEVVVEKLRFPEKDPCYQAMAGTALFTHTAFDMLQNHSRITAAVEKVELLWHQAFSKARFQLQRFQLREEALQITEQIKALHAEKLQPYRVEIAKDAAEAAKLATEFEATVHTPAMALVRCAEDVIHTLEEMLPFDGLARDQPILDLERLKEKLYSAVHFILQTLKAVTKYHHNYKKASRWYSLVLHENFLQDLLSGIRDGDPAQRQRRNWGTIPAWRHKISAFLRKNPAPHMEELVHLAHLANIIPDDEVQQAGKQMSHRCLTLRKLLISSGPVAVDHLQQALQWQYELLRNSRKNHSSVKSKTDEELKEDLSKCESVKKDSHLLTTPPSTAVCGLMSAEGKPASLSSFDSGFEGAGGCPAEACGGREAVEGLSGSSETRESMRIVLNQPQVRSVFDPEDHREEFDFGSVGNSSRASIQLAPREPVESLNFEIKVKRSATLPSNPWLSLPVDDLENLYTVTVTPNPAPQKRDLRFPDPLEPCTTSIRPGQCRDQPTQTAAMSRTQFGGTRNADWTLHSQSSCFEDSELSPIGGILSSTIDVGDKSVCTTEGVPTLLWDSYDLHEQKQDSVDGLTNVSLKDWDIKEQESLREVEEILDRTDEILEKEESVLAQEAVLDALLRSEEQHNPWRWGGESQHGGMSSSDLAEAGVLGLEDYLLPSECDSLSELGSAANSSSGDEQSAKVRTLAAPSRPDLLAELKKVRALDELIMEENLKIHKFRQEEEKPKPPDPDRTPKSRDREPFRMQLEKEKREVEKLEKSLEQEHKVKKQKDGAKRVVRCSIMGKARNESNDDQALWNELLSGSFHGSQRTRSPSLDLSDSQVGDFPDGEHVEAGLVPDGAKEATPQVLLDLRGPQTQDQHCEAEPPISDGTDMKAPPDDVEGMQPQGLIYGENAAMAKPEASLSPEMKPDDGAFDPGGQQHLLPPVAKPRTVSLPVDNRLEDGESSCSTDDGAPQPVELQIPVVSSVTEDPASVPPDREDATLDTQPENVPGPAVDQSFMIDADMKNLSSNNNNNNQPLQEEANLSLNHSSEDDEDTIVAAPFLERADLHPAEQNRTWSVVSDLVDENPSQVPPPEQPLKPGPSERDESYEDWADGVSRSEVVRVSGSKSPGIQAQLTVDMTDFKTPIVFDTGSGLMKAGFADQDLPGVIFPTIIGVPKYEEIMNGNLERETYIGHEAQHMRGVLALKHPIKNGIIRNWDEMEKIWHHTFQQLCVAPEDHPVLLTEAAMNPLENRQRMVEIMFECFNVPFAYVAMQAVLALYAAGRTTGVVFDSGDGVSHSVPVFDGYCLPHAVQRFPLAGVDVTMHLKKLLQEQGVCMRTTAEMEIVREIKEKCCCVALDYEAESNSGGACSRELHYTMPDGQVVTLATERFRAPEILFKPELIGRDHYGMHESLFKSVLSSDIDLRRTFLENIVLSGGNTLLLGLPERLQAEIKGLLPPDMGKSVHVSSPEDRVFSVWCGGAALANLPSFSSAWISQEEYEEHGPQIVFRKCF